MNELRDRRAYLVNEQSQLLDTQENTQNPTIVKSTSNRLAEITAELSAIQKALAAVIGLAALNSLNSVTTTHPWGRNYLMH